MVITVFDIKHFVDLLSDADNRELFKNDDCRKRTIKRHCHRHQRWSRLKGVYHDGQSCRYRNRHSCRMKSPVPAISVTRLIAFYWLQWTGSLCVRRWNVRCVQKCTWRYINRYRINGEKRITYRLSSVSSLRKITDTFFGVRTRRDGHQYPYHGVSAQDFRRMKGREGLDRCVGWGIKTWQWACTAGRS